MVPSAGCKQAYESIISSKYHPRLFISEYHVNEPYDVDLNCFFQTKGFYKEVSLECKKIEESPIRDEKLAALAHICGQLRPYVDLKCEMIEL